MWHKELIFHFINANTASKTRQPSSWQKSNTKVQKKKNSEENLRENSNEKRTGQS